MDREQYIKDNRENIINKAIKEMRLSKRAINFLLDNL